MRVANKTIYDSAVRDLGKTSSDMVDANEVVSSGKRINHLSDDPVGLVSVLGLRSSISNLDQMNRNISMGNSWLNASESALTQLNNIMTSTKALTVQMSSANVGSAERANNANLVDGYLKEVISLANSSSGGRYLFGGTNTNTTPFALNASGTQVTYSGNDTPFSVSIGKDTVVPVGKDGKDVFGASWDNSNIFKTFIDLKTSLENNDTAGIQNAMSNLDSHLKSIEGNISEIGGSTTRLNVKKSIVDDLKVSDTDRMSQIEDADLADAIVQLKSKELAYNAALTSTSKLMDLSLVNFVK